MSRPRTYSVSSYGEMIACEPRMSAFAEALRRTVTPGCTVLDLGAGTGIFSLLACRYGAGHVIAVEPGDTIAMLRPASAANGCADRITIVQATSQHFIPKVRADVIVSDLRGALPLFENHIPAIIDARRRLLAPGGTLIPARDRIHAALVDHPQYAGLCEEPWTRNRYGVDLSSGHKFVTNRTHKVKLDASALHAPPVPVAVLDYGSIDDPDLDSTIFLVSERSGSINGLALWFDTDLADGIGYSNAPGEPSLVYGQTFLPFEYRVDLLAGDRIEARIRAKLVDHDYIWSWNTKLWRASATQPEELFRQSSFFANPGLLHTLRRHADNHVPPADESRAVDARCLALLDGQRSLGDAARIVAGEFPSRFDTAAAALRHLAQLMDRYCREP